MRIYILHSLTLVATLCVIGCDSTVTINESLSLSSYDWKLPKKVYPPIVPSNNPMSKEKVELGRFLFYDTRLSANQKQSCASCHLQEYAFSDHNMVGIGSTGEHNIRNPNSLTNTGYYTSYSWANPALDTLERFIILPITGDSPIELGVVQEKEAEVLSRFENNETYRKMFRKAFPDKDNPYTLEYVVKALASFCRTLNSFDSPYDRYIGGDTNALSDSQKRGFDLFMGEKAECFHCHEGDRFGDSSADEKSYQKPQFFHNIGLYNIDDAGSYPDGNQGLYEITQQNSDKGRFKAPSLRNIELTFPYMHDGSMATLEEIIELHSNGGRDITNGANAGFGTLSPHKSDLVTAKKFTPQEKKIWLNFSRHSQTQHL